MIVLKEASAEWLFGRCKKCSQVCLLGVSCTYSFTVLVAARCKPKGIVCTVSQQQSLSPHSLRNFFAHEHELTELLAEECGLKDGVIHHAIDRRETLLGEPDSEYVAHLLMGPSARSKQGIATLTNGQVPGSSARRKATQ
eukprot:327841-Rhodomonas_salina.1